MGDIQDVYGGHEFDCNEVDLAKALPAGWYTAMVDESTVKKTNSGTGYYLKLKLSILSPEEFKSRVVFSNINLRNPNQQAEEIGMRELSALGHATGVMNIGDSAQILNKIVQIKLSVKNSEQYGVQNEVKGFKAPDGGVPVAMPVAGQQGAPAAEQAAAPAASKPPWKK